MLLSVAKKWVDRLRRMDIALSIKINSTGRQKGSIIKKRDP